MLYSPIERLNPVLSSWDFQQLNGMIEVLIKMASAFFVLLTSYGPAPSSCNQLTLRIVHIVKSRQANGTNEIWNTNNSIKNSRKIEKSSAKPEVSPGHHPVLFLVLWRHFPSCYVNLNFRNNFCFNISRILLKFATIISFRMYS